MQNETEIVLEDLPCPLCKQSEDRLLFTAKDRLHNLPGIFSVVQCSSCGLIRTNPRPTPESIGYYYPEDYGPYLSSQTDKKFHPALLLLRSILRKLVDFRERSLPPLTPPGNMLELGCASGSFLAEMQRKGWQVKGIEFSEKAAENARSAGFDVYAGALETAPEPEIKYDLITGWMVFEHLHYPLECLEKICAWTKKEGWLAISVPNAAYFGFNLFTSREYSLHIPNHLFHYTPETVKTMLEKTGWKVDKIYHQRNSANLYYSFSYILQDAGLKKTRYLYDIITVKNPAAPYLFYPLSLLLSLLGQTGRMTILAQKR